MTKENKNGFLPTMRIDQETKDILVLEAKRQGRSLANLVCLELRKVTEKIKAEEDKVKKNA